MLKRLEAGEERPEAVGRAPYATEFGENGRPLKAHGSATLVAGNASGE